MFHYWTESAYRGSPYSSLFGWSPVCLSLPSPLPPIATSISFEYWTFSKYFTESEDSVVLCSRTDINNLVRFSLSFYLLRSFDSFSKSRRDSFAPPHPNRLLFLSVSCYFSAHHVAFDRFLSVDVLRVV